MVFMVNLIQLIYSTVNYSPVRDDGDEEEEEDGYDNDDTLEVLKHDETILWIARFPSISSAMGQIQKLPHVEANMARVHLSHWRHPPVIAQLGDIGNVGPYIANIAVLCCFQFLSFVVILCQKTIEIYIYIILYIYIYIHKFHKYCLTILTLLSKWHQPYSNGATLVGVQSSRWDTCKQNSRMGKINKRL